MSMKNRILTGTAIVFAGVIGFFAINTFTSVFTGNGTDTVPISAPAVQAQTPTTTTTAPAAVVSSNRRTPSPAQTSADSAAVAKMRKDIVAYSEEVRQALQALADAQAANAAIIQRLAEDQSTQQQTDCQERLKELVANAGSSRDTTNTEKTTRGTGEEQSVTETTNRTSTDTSLMSQLLAASDGTSISIAVDGQVACSIIKDSADLEGVVSWEPLQTDQTAG